ncbi:MAG: lamin tail domain-containing protein, partial [Verrucomicrobiales bacterium]
EWSALNAAFFSIDTAPADASNLVISEIHYRPEDPSDPLELAVSGDRDDYEFIELENIGDQALDLSGLRFSAGIDYTFPPQSLLESGGRVILVRDTEAFAVRYPGVTPAGEYGGRLSNDGELVELVDADGAILRRFAYNDQLPWPTAPDGDGLSLVLVAPLTNPDHAQASSWRPSVNLGGSPGESDATAFSGDPASLLEYALGSSEGSPVAGFIEIEGLIYPAFTIERNHAADDAVVAVEYSTDLIVWRTDAILEVAPHGQETWRTPAGRSDRLYWRVQVSLRE